ncbi:MAG: hypothetical protein AB7I59_29240 [Geminicoccaceae bacterium]
MTDQPPPDGEGNEPRRIVLPKNIGRTLQHLDDFDLEAALRRAAEQELHRRQAEKGEESETLRAKHPPTKAPRATTTTAQKRWTLPTGKASLIKASFQAGLRPQAIARSLRPSLADVESSGTVANSRAIRAR